MTGGLYGIVVADIRGSTFSGNRAAGSYNGGGAIFNANGKLTITNSTISGNSSDGDGGGIRNQSYASFGSPSKVSLDGVTLADNTADADTDGTGTGGNLYSGANDSDGTIATTAKNTILANAARGGDCAGSMVSGGHVLMEDAAGCEISGDTTGNVLGQDQKLGPLAANGGPTATHLLASDSPAVDAGSSTLAKDQRGVIRPQDGNDDGNSAPDSGAVEKRPDETVDLSAPTVSATEPVADKTGVPVGDNVTATFSEAVREASLSGNVTLAEDGQTTSVPAAVTYDAASHTVTVNPDANLAHGTTYVATIKGGASGVKDMAGNALQADKVWRFTTAALADTTAPAAPAISSPANNSYDLDGTIAFSGTAEAGSTVRIFEGTTLKGTAAANSSGAWAKTLSGVANGRHTYTAKATDKANNTSAASAPRTVTVDKVKPKVLGTSPLAGATGIAPKANVTATFSEGMNANTLRNPDTLRSTTFKLARKNPDGTTTAVLARVSYSVTTDPTTGAKVYRATLNPDANLQLGKTYAATVTGGAKDLAGNALDQDPSVTGNQAKAWTFRVRN